MLPFAPPSRAPPPSSWLLPALELRWPCRIQPCFELRAVVTRCFMPSPLPCLPSSLSSAPPRRTLEPAFGIRGDWGSNLHDGPLVVPLCTITRSFLPAHQR